MQFRVKFDRKSLVSKEYLGISVAIAVLVAVNVDNISR